MAISVIIPCRNEEAILPALLRSLTQQTERPAEIIVVDSASTDKTAQVAEKFKGQLSLRVVSSKKGIALARNAGAQASCHEMLLFIDADITLPIDFLACFTKYVTSHQLQAGSVLQKMPQAKLSLRLGTIFMNIYLRLMSHTPYPIGFSCLFATREVHDNLGGFDSTLFIMEDYDYILRARRAGYRTGVVKNTRFFASPRRFEGKGFRQILTGIYGEFYRYTHGLRVEKEIYRYKMGGK